MNFGHNQVLSSFAFLISAILASWLKFGMIESHLENEAFIFVGDH